MIHEFDRAKKIRKIENLLRIARDRKGDAEGDTAQAMANLLMRRHGLQVVLEDRKRFAERELRLSADAQPVAWKEWLGWTLAVAYRCDHEPRWTGFSWEQWISATEARRAAACLSHYTFISGQIQNRTEHLRRNLLRATSVDLYIRSYSEGLACGCSVALLGLLGWDGCPPFVADAFDHDAYLATARDPLEILSLGHQEFGLVPYVHRASADSPIPSSHPPPEIPPVTPNLYWMQKGQRDTRYILLTSSFTPDAFKQGREAQR